MYVHRYKHIHTLDIYICICIYMYTHTYIVHFNFSFMNITPIFNTLIWTYTRIHNCLQIDGIFARADKDGNTEIDFEEFMVCPLSPNHFFEMFLSPPPSLSLSPPPRLCLLFSLSQHIFIYTQIMKGMYVYVHMYEGRYADVCM